MFQPIPCIITVAVNSQDFIPFFFFIIKDQAPFIELVQVNALLEDHFQVRAFFFKL
jgi:hypothetical protein